MIITFNMSEKDYKESCIKKGEIIRIGYLPYTVTQIQTYHVQPPVKQITAIRPKDS